ncbi:MAG: TraB/GumN family protein [Candidatus Protochlamydia sp.]|nr:TraB/GumN family protein [Candidatus Protochlamydia sp.]
MQSQPTTESNYLYFVIEDSDHKIRGNIIGAQHWVQEKDKDFNHPIREAIKRSARAILEMPPESQLLPSEPDNFNYVIDKVITHINVSMDDGISEIHPALKEKISSCLKDIKEKTSYEGYSKVAMMLEKIQSEENKLNFVQGILDNIFEFNLVSLEENLNNKLKAANKKIESLESINLREQINQAEQKIKLRLESEKIDVQKAENTQENKAKHEHEEALYKAWVDGDAIQLGKLLDKDFELNEEPPEIDEVHRPRDREMAKRIIEVVCQAKEEGSEATIMMGCAHLLYTKRKNIIVYLEESFKKDLSGWTVRQIKNST